MTAFARPFRLVFSDGTTADGVQFPSGQVVIEAAVSAAPAGRAIIAMASLDALLNDPQAPNARIEWADEEAACESS